MKLAHTVVYFNFQFMRKKKSQRCFILHLMLILNSVEIEFDCIALKFYYLTETFDHHLFPRR